MNRFVPTIPEADFHIVKDVERGHIVNSGTKEDMQSYAEMLNDLYQSTAYRVEAWISHNKE